MEQRYFPNAEQVDCNQKMSWITFMGSATYLTFVSFSDKKQKTDTLYIQYTVKPSLQPDMYFTMTLNVERGKSFYDVMKIASNASSAFR